MKKFKFKTKVPKLHQYIGRRIEIDDKPVVIQTLVGNRFKPTFYEINGEHLIGMLRFHARMEGDHSITEQQFKDFEEMDLHAERMDPKEKKVMGQV